MFFNNTTSTFSQQETFINPDSCYFENILLSTDRELYIAGENIWFKANCFVNNSASDSLLSKIIYLELYNHQTKTVANGKFRLIDGIATGFLSTPQDVVTGNYFLRAYTQFLRNSSAYSYPTTLITIVNPKKPIKQNVHAINDILIVPEGGKMIAGIPTKLAIRVNPQITKKLRRAFITDENKNKLVEFEPAKNGLAMVNFLPETTEQYFIQLNIDDGSVLLKPLPKVIRNGMFLRSDVIEKNLQISLISNEIDKSSTGIGYSVEIKDHSNASIITRTIKPNEPIKISNNLLNKGLIYILLKNKDNELLDISSKLICDVDFAEIKFRNTIEHYNPRENIELTVELPGEDSKNCNYQIAVSKIGTNCPENLLPFHISYSPVFLDNFLKNFPVISDSIKAQISISLILYSPIFNSNDFKEELLRQNYLKFIPEIRDVGLNGFVVDKQTRKPMKDIMVFAAVISENKQLHAYKTKEDGEFYFSFNHLTKNQNVFISTRQHDSLKCELLINGDFLNKYPYTEIIPFLFDVADKELLDELYLNYQLNKTFSYSVNKVEEKQQYSPFLIEDQEFTVFLKDFIKIPAMSEVFNEIVPFVSARKSNNNYYLNVFNRKSAEFYDDPLVLIDGLPVFDIDELMKISPESVEKIEVNTRKYYLGENCFEGVIRISTKTKNFAGISLSKESEFFEFQTVTPESYPIFPDYTPIATNNRIPDFRNLLFWDANKKFAGKMGKIQFYSSDHCGEYEIIIRGYKSGQRYFFGKTRINVIKNLKDSI